MEDTLWTALNDPEVLKKCIPGCKDMIPAGEYNPHNIRLWLLHDHGFTVCAVFATSLQDALDIAVDENKMDRYLIDEDIMDVVRSIGDLSDAMPAWTGSEAEAGMIADHVLRWYEGAAGGEGN